MGTLIIIGLAALLAYIAGGNLKGKDEEDDHHFPTLDN